MLQIVDLRLVHRIEAFGRQDNQIALLPEILYRSLIAIHHDHRKLSVFHFGLLSDKNLITVIQPGGGHAVPAYCQPEVACPIGLHDGQVPFNVFFNVHRQPCPDGSEQRSDLLGIEQCSASGQRAASGRLRGLIALDVLPVLPCGGFVPV